MGKTRRMVEYAGRAPRGGHTKAWAYDYQDLAELLGTTTGALRARVSRGTFTPGSLDAICREWATARGIVVALALGLGLAAAGCGDLGGEAIDQPGTGGARAELGAGGAGSSGVGGARAPGAGGAGHAGAPAGSGGTGVGGALAGAGGAAAGTGGAAAAGVGGAPGAGGAAPTIPECNGTGRPDSAWLCGYAGITDAKPWVYMFKDGLRCATCFSSAGVPQATECLDSLDNPAELCVQNCADACAY